MTGYSSIITRVPKDITKAANTMSNTDTDLNIFLQQFPNVRFKRTIIYVNEKSHFTNINDPIWPQNFHFAPRR